MGKPYKIIVFGTPNQAQNNIFDMFKNIPGVEVEIRNPSIEEGEKNSVFFFGESFVWDSLSSLSKEKECPICAMEEGIKSVENLGKRFEMLALAAQEFSFNISRFQEVVEDAMENAKPFKEYQQFTSSRINNRRRKR